jgi:basic membrane protein A
MENLSSIKSNRRVRAVRFGVSVGLATLLLAALRLMGANSAPTVASAPTGEGIGALSNGSVITIGVAQDLSTYPELGWPQANAVQLAISETNAAGGIDIGGVNYTLALVTEDDAADLTQAITAANALLDAGAVAVVGHTFSAISGPAQATYAAAGVPMVSASSTNPSVTEQGYTTTFRTISRDDAAAVLLATQFRKLLGLGQAAIVELSSLWAAYSTDAFSSTFTHLGGTITSRRSVSSTAEYTATLTAIQAENPDAIFYVDRDAGNAGLFSYVAHDLGMTEVIIGWDSPFDDESLLDTYAGVAGPAAEGDYAGMLYRRTEDMPGYEALNAAYQAAGFPNYGAEAGLVGAFAYDAAKIIIAAIDRADSTDPAAIRDEISATVDHEGVVGTYEGFDAQGDVIPQWSWLERYYNGQWLRAISVGLVVPDPTIEEGPFSWDSYQGLLRAESEMGVVGTVYTSTSSADWEPNLQQCADDGNDLCISVSFLMGVDTAKAAVANPNQNFAIVDYTYPDCWPGAEPGKDCGSDTELDNVRGLTFAADEAAYLAGALAGWMTESDVVGDIGGIDILPVVRYVEGYRNGAQCANPAVTVLITYTDTFVDPDVGAQAAQDMIAEGADVIFAAAGPTGEGAVLTATQSAVWGIGVDTDWYVSTFGNGTVAGSDKLLSSAMKRMDNAVFDTIADVVSGTFTSGTVLYDLAVDGVALAPFHETDPYVPQSVRDALQRVEQGIIDGTIDVSSRCPALQVSKMLVEPGDCLAAVSDTITFTVHITNTGPTTVTQVPLWDYYCPACLEVASWSMNPSGVDADLGVMHWADVLSPTLGGPGMLLPGETTAVTLDFYAVVSDTMYWKEAGWMDYAPKGMPDFDQKQDQWDNPAGSGAGWYMCGPVAAANSLWWFDSKFEPDPIPPPAINDGYPLVHSHNLSVWDDHYPRNVQPMVNMLAGLMGTTPVTGTNVHNLANGIEQYINDQGLTGQYSVTLIKAPGFQWVEEQVRRSQDIVLLLGLWQEVAPGYYLRSGGHYVTVAGIDSLNEWIAFSDPYGNHAELGGLGRVLPNQHDKLHPSPGPVSDTVHNDAKYASHDVYAHAPSPSPAGSWGPMDYALTCNEILDFEGQNEGDYPSFATCQPGLPIYTEVEYAVAVSPITPTLLCKPTDNFAVVSGAVDEHGFQVPETQGHAQVKVNQKPELGTVDPSSGSGTTGVTTYFTTTWVDANGRADLKQCYFHIGDSPSIVGNVTLMYNAVKNKLWMRTDDGAVWFGGHAPGSANTMENSQAIVHCSLTTAQGAGDTLAVKWAIEFKPGYEGDKKTGLKCKDRQKAKAKGKWKGTWTVE